MSAVDPIKVVSKTDNWGVAIACLEAHASLHFLLKNIGNGSVEVSQNFQSKLGLYLVGAYQIIESVSEGHADAGATLAYAEHAARDSRNARGTAVKLIVLLRLFTHDDCE